MNSACADITQQEAGTIVIPPVAVAFLTSQNAPVNSSCGMEWAELSEMLRDVKISNSKDGLAWMPAEIEPGARNGERVQGVTALVLDIEARTSKDTSTGIKTVIWQEPPATDEIAAELSLSGHACILHTSFHHHDTAILPSDKPHPRYRVVFAVSRPLAKEEIKPLALHVAILLGLSDCVDTSCMEPAHLFFLPRCPAERIDDFRHEVIEGVPLDVDALLNDAYRVSDALAKATKKKCATKTGGVIDAFNNTYEPGAILEQHGYLLMRNRWMHPKSTTGMPGVRSLPDTSPERVYSSHSNDPLNDGHAHDAFDCFRILKHGGDIKAAVKKAAHMLGMQSQKTAPPGSDSSLSIALDDAMPLSESTAQSDTSLAQSDDEIIQWLASLMPLEYDRVRKEQATALKVRPGTLDAMVKGARSDESEAGRLPFDEVEPHPKPIDPAQLLDEVSATIQRYIVLDTEQAQAAALWCALTWFIDVVEVAPLAIINAPEKSCGKTQLLTVLGRMAYRPLPASNASASALFRAVELWKPTILIDEADTFFRDNAELQGMVNAGYLRDGYVLRSEAVGDNFVPRMFSVFSAKAIAGIALEKHLSDATMSRGVLFNLRRKLSHESVNRLRNADRDIFVGTAKKLARFAADYSQHVRLARPALPDALSDRDQDNWEPLLAIASCAGDVWLARATAAALKLSGTSEKVAGIGNELLADIQHVFESQKLDKISTAKLIEELCIDQEGAWAAYNRGKQITSRQFAKLLKPYGIASKSIRVKTDTPKGFELSQFSDAFERYLSTPQNLPQHPQHPLNTSKRGALGVADNPPQKITGNDAATLKGLNSFGCGGVADKTPISWGARPKVSILGANI